MRRGTKLAALENDEGHGTDNGNEVEREVHEISDDSTGSKLGEWLRHKLTQLSDRVASRLDLALGGHQRGLASREQSAIEGVNQGIVDKEILAQDIEDGRLFTQYKQNSTNNGERPVEERQERDLRHIGDGEHQHCHPKTERYGGDQFRGERLP